MIPHRSPLHVLLMFHSLASPPPASPISLPINPKIPQISHRAIRQRKRRPSILHQHELVPPHRHGRIIEQFHEIRDAVRDQFVQVADIAIRAGDVAEWDAVGPRGLQVLLDVVPLGPGAAAEIEARERGDGDGGVVGEGGAVLGELDEGADIVGLGGGEGGEVFLGGGEGVVDFAHRVGEFLEGGLQLWAGNLRVQFEGRVEEVEGVRVGSVVCWVEDGRAAIDVAAGGVGGEVFGGDFGGAVEGTGPACL